MTNSLNEYSEFTQNVFLYIKVDFRKFFPQKSKILQVCYRALTMFNVSFMLKFIKLIQIR